MEERKLGRGLDSILGQGREVAVQGALQIPIDQVFPNRYQPRKEIDPDALQGLVQSIEQKGILQPIIVRRAEGGYEIIAGERRWRAACELGMTSIPALVKEVTDEEVLELALIENIQREDLNPIDRASAYKRLMEEFKLNQEEAAARVGQNRSTVANYLRLLELAPVIQEGISSGKISLGHGLVILSLPVNARALLCQKIIEQGLSVRRAEKLAKTLIKPSPPKRKAAKTREILELEARLRQALASKVEIRDRGGRGQIIIRYHNQSEFNRLLEQLSREEL